ncbi:MAG: HAD family phosphatase [Bacteroidales bacterium]|nr:HAD family phosphatase [Bacteroidales bacterium]
MAKAYVFDIGGVLIGLDLKACIRAFQDILGFDRITELLDPYHQKGIYGELEAGQLSADDFRARILAESRPGSAPEDVDRCMAALLTGMDPRTVAAVKQLEVPRYLLSNNNPISMARCREILCENGLGEAFAAEFISSDMKLMKPSRAFYEEVLRCIGLPAGEIVFIDDNLANVEGAKAVGIDARLFVPGTDIRAVL